MSKAGKFLALILRHRPEVGGLTLDGEGWAPVDSVLAALRTRFGAFTHDDLEALVRADEKGRYAFDAAGLRIRASQGHSVAVDLGLAPVEPPETLYHGTVARFLESILAEGLKPGSRQHVHLSPDVGTARQVAARRAGDKAILEVASLSLARTGHPFYKSANGVWLTGAVPPEFLAVVQ